eukprot:955514-Amphidinium_carterae.4
MYTHEQGIGAEGGIRGQYPAGDWGSEFALHQRRQGAQGKQLVLHLARNNNAGARVATVVMHPREGDCQDRHDLASQQELVHPMPKENFQVANRAFGRCKDSKGGPHNKSPLDKRRLHRSGRRGQSRSPHPTWYLQPSLPHFSQASSRSSLVKSWRETESYIKPPRAMIHNKMAQLNTQYNYTRNS